MAASLQPPALLRKAQISVRFNYLSSPSTIVIPTDFGLPSPSAPEAPTTLGVEGTQAIVPLTLPKLADAGEQHDDENFTVYNFLHEGASESTSERIG